MSYNYNRETYYSNPALPAGPVHPNPGQNQPVSTPVRYGSVPPTAPVVDKRTHSRPARKIRVATILGSITILLLIILLKTLLASFFYALLNGDLWRDTNIPAYPGAVVIKLNDQTGQDLALHTLNIQKVKNYAIQAFKTSDSPASVAAFFQDYLTQAGWRDLTTKVIQQTPQYASEARRNIGRGGFSAVYGVENKGVVLSGVSGKLVDLTQFPGVSSSDTVFFVVTYTITNGN